MGDFDFIASYYDRTFGPPFAEVATPLLAELLRGNEPAGPILDACCGAGHLAAALTQDGFHVDCVDVSAPMVRFARDRVPHAWIGDVRELGVENTYAVVLCTYNSLNHLDSEDGLLAACRSVWRALRGGGGFVFDLLSAEGARHSWAGTFASVCADDVCVIQAAFDDERGSATSDITLFVRSGGSWRRVDGQLRLRTYSDDQVRSALLAAGFVDVEVTDWHRATGRAELAGRWLYRARKPR